MDVIAVIAQKGGTGKTTLTLALAVAAQLAGKVTAIVDLDPQSTASNWSDRREAESPVVVSAQPARLSHVLTSAEWSAAALCLTDSPPPAGKAALRAAKAAYRIPAHGRAAIY